MKTHTTKSLYYIDGCYSEKRKPLHEEIIEKALSTSEPFSDYPDATLIGGGSGSGKSSVITEFLIQATAGENGGIVVIDCDNIKHQIPDFLDMINSGNKEVELAASDFVHEESSDIAEQLLTKCIESRRNFIYDGTMKNFIKYDEIIKKLKISGYTVRAMVVDVPIEVAIERIQIREELDKRHVSIDTVIETHVQCVDTFKRLKNLFDEYTLFDNTGDDIQVFAYRDLDGNEVIENQERFIQFENKPQIYSTDNQIHKI